MKNKYLVAITLIGYLFNFSCQKGSSSPSSTTNSALNNGLIAYYPFDGNVKDSSGRGNNGTVNGTITYTNDRFNNPNKSAVLGSGFISTSGSFFNFQYNSSFTVSCWFTIAGNGTSSLRLISSENPEGNFRIASYANGVYAVQFGDVYLYDTIQLNTWNNIIYTCQNNIGSIYRNGNLKQQKPTSTQILSYGNPFTIGGKASSTNSSSDYWSGNIDELRIYNRVLTDAEIQYLYSH